MHPMFPLQDTTFFLMEESIGLHWTGHAVIDMGVAAAVLEAGVDSPKEVKKAQWKNLMDELEDDYVAGLLKKPSGLLLSENTFENPAFSSSSSRKKKTPGTRHSIFVLHEGSTYDATPLPKRQQKKTDRPETTIDVHLLGGRPEAPIKVLYDVPHDSKREQDPSWHWITRDEKIKAAFDAARGTTLSLPEQCVYFDEAQAATYAARDRAPLLQAQSEINFYPNGQFHLPISSLAFGCILLLPLVSPVVSGRLMIAESKDRELLLDLCSYWHQQLKKEKGNRRLDTTVRSKPRTRLFEALQQAYMTAEEHPREVVAPKHSGIVLYHLSNSGIDPSVEVFRARPQILGFVERAQTARYKPLFNALTQAYWRDTNRKLKSKEHLPDGDENAIRKNLVYELLPDLPERSPFFIERRLLRYVLNRFGIDESFEAEDRDLWPLTQLFLTEVMHMTEERIEVISKLADDLAQEIVGNNDKPLYRDLMGTSGGRDRYTFFQQLLVRTARRRLERGEDLLLSLDDYLLAFEEGEEFPRADWRLARNLLRLRLLEVLNEKAFFDDPSEVPTVDEDEPDENEQSEGEKTTVLS